MVTPLNALKPGQAGRLLSLGGERAWRRRLMELGFVPGTRLLLVRRVGVGDVLEVELRHSRISLRISEAGALSVEPIA